MKARNPAYKRGDLVTLPGLQFHSKIKDVHISHRMKRGDAEVLVGEGEDVDGVDGEPIESYVSYLVHRQWDDTDLWVAEEQIVKGHDFTIQSG